MPKYAFTINENENYTRLCKINGGKYNNKYISYYEITNDKDDLELEQNQFKDFTRLTLKEGKLEPTPWLKKDKHGKIQRQIMLVSGAQGSGKSTYIEMYCKNYNSTFKTNDVYLFSKIQDDESLKDIKNTHVVPIDEEIKEIELTELENSICIFDDVEKVREKKIRDNVYGLMDDIYQNGRHNNICMIASSHVACGGNQTKTQILESQFVTYFMSSGTNYERLIMTYLGFTRKEYDALKRINSRWITVYRQAPVVIFFETGILLKSDLLDFVGEM